MIICGVMHKLEFYGRWCLYDGASVVTLTLFALAQKNNGMSTYFPVKKYILRNK